MNELIYVIAGKEDSLVNTCCSELLDKLMEPSQRATGLFNADTISVMASEVLDELRTAPFLTDKRIVLVKDADKFISANRELLEKYFDNPCSTGRLIFTVRTWDTRTKLARKLAKAGKLINIKQPNRSELPQRLIKYADNAHGKKLGRDAAEILIELTGEELSMLYGEIDKLALFVDKEKIITVKHVESLIGHNRLFNVFAVIDAVIDGNVGVAVERLRSMFAQDKSSEFSVVGAFAYHLRRMFDAKILLDKGVRTDEIARKCNVWSQRDKFFSQLRKKNLKQIGGYLQQLAEADYNIKTGRTKAPVAMEQFVLQLSNH
ncbi:MAG: DNA polymerase III subunit delta [Sedimentisphaerales bacterium]|nr:DNA polymerase III subunit delta [Sedimentisphaerales bacterium]